MLDIETLTLGEIKKINALFHADAAKPEDDSHWVVGKVYLIRTVTMIQTGRLVKVTDKELVLEDAAWIADTGRFADALDKIEFEEVEPFPDNSQVIVGRGALIDALQLPTDKPPRKQK